MQQPSSVEAGVPYITTTSRWCKALLSVQQPHPLLVHPVPPKHPIHTQELSSFMALQKDEELVIDNSPEGDLLKISFNIRCVCMCGIGWLA